MSARAVRQFRQRQPWGEDVVAALACKKRLRAGMVDVAEDGTQDFSEAFALIESTISQAHQWGRYYEKRHKQQLSRARQRKRLARATKTAAKRLRLFVRRHWAGLTAAIEPLASQTHPLSHTSINAILEHAARLESVADTLAKPLPGTKGGPTDARVLGFIWGMAHGWAQLTTFKIGPHGGFPEFLQAAWGTHRPAPNWEALIRIAVRRWRITGARWLRPGDDFDQFEV
jgi:hypothetical protein